MMPQFIWFSILSFLLILDPCWTKPVRLYDYEYEELGVELPSPSPSPSVDVSIEFSQFESRMRLYIDNVKRGQLTTMSNMSQFLGEVDKYIARVPMNATKIVTTRTRDVCHCEGQMMSPCPVRCMYSCYIKHGQAYIKGGWHYDDDCRDRYWDDCKCTKDSSTSCYEYSQLETCINTTTEVLPVVTSCSQYVVDKEDLIGAFELGRNLLMEPLNKYFRSVESRLNLLKQTSLNIKSLAKIAPEMCNGDTSENCANEADQLLSVLKTNYRQHKKNMTLELIKTQIRVEQVSQKLDELKEQTIAKINRSIKEYSCCQKVPEFPIDGYDCSDMNAEHDPPSSTEMSETTSTTTLNSRIFEWIE